MLHFFNTLTKKKELFTPLKKGEVSMYNCGPTVYGYAHIGNFSSYLMADLIRRYLEYLGYEVHQIKNITDVGHLTSDADEGEDKMEKTAREQKKDPYEIARFYEEAYLKDEKRLHILDAEKRPRATEHVEEMIEMIQMLITKGFAYETPDGVYFDIKSFGEYGKLSGNTLDQLNAGERVNINEHKHHPADFALWKKLVGENSNHIMKWQSPWGDGFPGWHIECSAMSKKYLGETIDIHTGGEDNIFPHHECEIAQSEACNEKPFVNYWIHKSFFHINDEKMSKSKGNVYNLQDIVDMGYDPLDFRFLMLSVHYRSRLNFSKKGLDDAKGNRKKMQGFIKKIQSIVGENDDKNISNEVTGLINKVKESFEKSMNDDLNTSAALASVFDLMKKVNHMMDSELVTTKSAQHILEFFEKINSVFVFLDMSALAQDKEIIPEEVLQIAEERVEARKCKDYTKSDELRDKIQAAGYSIKDVADAYEIEKLS